MFVASYGAGPIVAAAAPQAITVDLDLSFLVQSILFVCLMLALKPLLFDPMLKLFEERERRIDGAKLQARKIDQKSATALDQYETAMARARASANAERDKLRAEGVAQEQQILAKIRAATSASVEDGKRAAHAEAARVRAKLRLDADAIARDLASRALGREVLP